MIGLLTCYILALQYGGQTHPWKSATVIGLFVGFVLLLSAFVAWQLFQKEYAMIVPRIASLVLYVLRNTRSQDIAVRKAIHLVRRFLHGLLLGLLLRRPLLPPSLLPGRP
jgi:hypothetical protein